MDFAHYNYSLFKEFTEIIPSYVIKNSITEIDNQKFIFNNEGHRGNNFKKNIDLLYAGCSLTFGSGLPQEVIWGEMFDKNIEVNNLSYRGGSIVNIVNNIFNYINKYEDPKVILCCFPSSDRIRWFDDNIVTDCNELMYGFSDYQNLVWSEEDVEKYIRLPVPADKIIHGQIARYFSIFAINALENYCNAKKIYFKWTSWAPDSAFSLFSFKNKINFIEKDTEIVYENDKWILVDRFKKEIKCHEDHIDNVFYKATDTGSGWPHMGKHIHMHIAEAFKKEIENDNPWN